MNWVAIYTAFSFAVVPIALPFMMPANSSNVIWAQTCTGRLIALDLGNQNPPDTPSLPHAKACHAVCCQRGDNEVDADGQSQT